jgi:RNA polymerase-binding transcription factor DksA
MAKNKKTKARKAASKAASKKTGSARRKAAARAKPAVASNRKPPARANGKPPARANDKPPASGRSKPQAGATPQARTNGKPRVLANGKSHVAAKSKPQKSARTKPQTPTNGKPPEAANGKPSAAANGSPHSSPTMEKPSKKNALRDSILKRKTAGKPIAFSLDEVRAIAQTVSNKAAAAAPAKSTKTAPAKNTAILEKTIKPQHVKAASLTDILGFNPKKGRAPEPASDKDVPEKFKRYHKLLIDLRTSLTEGIERHSEETLKRSAKDDAGDLSAYGQHMADAGTDTFDRDFALSMVASEQEALSEIDAAIKRIYSGSYGICEITQKPIAKERLLAVPFTRYSAEAQKDIERNRHRTRTQAGLFGELGEEGGKIIDEDSGDE